MVRAWAAGAAGGDPTEARAAEASLEHGVGPALESLLEMARPRAAATVTTRCVEVQLLMLLGRHEEALDALEAARDERSLAFTQVHAPVLDPLAGHARFRTLMEDAGLLFPRWRRSR